MTSLRDGRLITGTAGTAVFSTASALGVVEIAVFDPATDGELLHRWVTRPTAGFWGLADLSMSELRELYGHVDALPTHHAFLVRRDGLPVALLQTYEPEHDPVGAQYTVERGDVGIHFLLGDRGAPTPGFTTRLGFVVGEFLFARAEADRIVIEPDVGNDRALARMRRFGFEPGPRVTLPGKVGQLAFLTRERWEALRPGRGPAL